MDADIDTVFQDLAMMRLMRVARIILMECDSTKDHGAVRSEVIDLHLACPVTDPTDRRTIAENSNEES